MVIFAPTRLVGFGAETVFAIGFVCGIVAVKPDYPAVTFKGENMSRDTIRKPAIMADDDRAAGKIF